MSKFGILSLSLLGVALALTGMAWLGVSRVNDAHAAVIGTISANATPGSIPVGGTSNVAISIAASNVSGISAVTFRVAFPAGLTLGAFTCPVGAACNPQAGFVDISRDFNPLVSANSVAIVTLPFTGTTVGAKAITIAGAQGAALISCADAEGSDDSCGGSGTTITVNAPAGDSSTFSIAGATVTEGSTATLTITRTVVGTPGAVTLTCTPTNGTAGSDDHATGVVNVSFGAGENSKTCAFATTDDALVEGTEAFTVTLAITSGGTTSVTGGAATVTINDNDAAPTPGSVSFSAATSNVNESSPGAKTVAVQRTGGSAGAITVVCTVTALGTATNGTDFTATVSQPITFAAGETSKTCSYTLNQDTIVEGTETIVLTLTNTGEDNDSIIAPSTHTVTILDDDQAPGGSLTPTPTTGTGATPPMPTNTPFPTNTATATNTARPTDTALPTNTQAGITNTATATRTSTATTGAGTATNTTAAGGTIAPLPPKTGTGGGFGGTSTVAALVLVAIGLAVSGFAATRVTRKG